MTLPAKGLRSAFDRFLLFYRPLPGPICLLGPAHLSGQAVGDPEVGAMLAQERLDHVLSAIGANAEAAFPKQHSR